MTVIYIHTTSDSDSDSHYTLELGLGLGLGFGFGFGSPNQLTNLSLSRNTAPHLIAPHHSRVGVVGEGESHI
ncbi:hypothetical protein PNOK_0953400 [Pyrrhoderma noxium]|uniref:Uncharacterized protein n=1 Tax=Pyrrhoderma noxium TaxID=2282107 RepID=A0A286U5V2_9AGAM|nr:hypothetical protein PNOK_0953400 [Pyrrhoderma noxium]